MCEALIEWPRCPENTRWRRWGVATKGGGWIDKQYPKEFQRVAPLVQETQYILPWKQVGTLSFPLKAWNSVGFTDLFLKSHKECEFYANVSNIFQLFQEHLRKFLILQKDETIFCKSFFFRFHQSLLTVISFAAVVGIEVEVSLVLTYLSTCAHLSPPSSSSLLSFIREGVK